MSALVIGTALALLALVVVLYPLFTSQPPPRAGAQRRRARAGAPREELPAVVALREVEFDRETGKLSDSDYAALRAAYTREALHAMRAADAAAAAGRGTATDDAMASGAPTPSAATAAPTDEELEAAIARFRAAPSCEECGPRPETDALYCSTCGRWLAGQCRACGASVTEADARYCGACGGQLAA